MSSVNRIVPTSFFAGVLFSLIGAYLKVRHLDGANYVLAAGLLCSVVFIIFALVEVWNTDRVRKQDRILWTIAIVFLGGIGGLIYLIKRRTRAVNSR